MKYGLILMGILWGWNHSEAAVSMTDLQRIYHKLTTAVGDYRQEIPHLEIRTTKGQVATYSRLKNTIYIEEAVLAVCEEFGQQTDDAIAFLLAHELTHFYQKHDWQEAGFASTFLSSKTTFERQRSDEEEADTYGAFVSYLAGYETVKIIPTLLEKLYVAYNLTEQTMSNYPTLATRQSVANQVCEQVKKLIRIYEAGNYFFALDQLEEAYYCFQYVAKYVRCKEVLNNLGATALYAATLMTDYDQLAFAYPIALDPKLPLRAPSDLTKKELLAVANEQLSLATQYDPTYYRAFINLVCVYEMQQLPRQQNELLQQLAGLSLSTTERAQLLILQGITAAHQQQNSDAKQFFKQAKKLTNDYFIKRLAKRNEKILAGKSFENATPPTTVINDQINDYDLLLHSPEPQQHVVLSNNGVNDIILMWQTLPNALFFSMNNKKVLLTTTVQVSTQKGIRIGDQSEQINSNYDSDATPLIAKGGHWFVQPTQGLIFELTDNGQSLKRWGIYRVD